MSDLAVFHTFVRPPWGGGNQFMLALCREFARRGLQLSFNQLPPGTPVCLFNSFNFDFAKMRQTRHEGCRMLHRVDGPVAIYRGMNDGTDQRLWELNKDIADVSIFQSHYSLHAHETIGMHFTHPIIIRNAVDPRIFYPAPQRVPLTGRKLRIISSSWSTNQNKGVATYQWLDKHLDWTRMEYKFVGRTPVTFTNIRHVAALPSEQVAELLREHDVFITASLHDPSSNALLEALSCGLPALYANSGGHAEIVGAGGIGFTHAEEIPALLDQLSGRYDAYVRAIDVPSLADIADKYLQVAGIPCGERHRSDASALEEFDEKIFSGS